VSVDFNENNEMKIFENVQHRQNRDEKQHATTEGIRATSLTIFPRDLGNDNFKLNFDLINVG
jgi:hypothetical protein